MAADLDVEAEPAPPPSVSSRLTSIAVGVVILLGVLERVLLYPRVPTNSDEALAGLMARDLWHGHVSLWLWGQQYGGTAELLPLAAITKVFGHSLLAQRAFTMILGAGVAVLGWRVGRRLIGNVGGLVAGSVLWLWPVWFVSWSMHEYLYYVPLLALALGAMLVALRARDAPGSPFEPVAVGLLLGVGWWVSPNIILYVPSVVLLLVLNRPGWLRRMLLASGGAVVGAAPWIVYNLRHGFASLDTSDISHPATYGQRLGVLFHDGAPVVFGTKGEARTWVLPHGHALTLALLALASVVAVVALIRWSKGPVPPVDVVGLLVYPFLYAISTVTGTPSLFIPRYFFFAWPWLAFLAARLFVWPALQRLAAPAMVLLAVVSIQQVLRLPMPDHRYDYHELARTLDDLDVDRIFTSYWQSYLLDEVAGGRVIATPELHQTTRHEPWDRAVRNAPHPAWLFLAGSGREKVFVDWLHSTGRTARTIAVNGFRVYVPDTKVLPEDVPKAVLAHPTEGV